MGDEEKIVYPLNEAVRAKMEFDQHMQQTQQYQH